MNDKVIIQGKKYIDALYKQAHDQIAKGDIHENQGYELQPKLDNWIVAYDKYLTYQEKMKLVDYFTRKMDSLVSKGSSQI
jgi:hypothetical protein